MVITLTDEKLSEILFTPENAKENLEKSKTVLKGYFKTLYDNAGMEWTEENDKEIDFIFNSILLVSVNMSGDLITEALTVEK